MHKMSLSSSCSSHKRKTSSCDEKTTAVLKRAMTEKSDGTWEHAKPQGKWKEVSADYEVLDALVKEEKITWTKSCMKSVKREADLHNA